MAPLFLAQAAAPALRKAQGAIVNLADIHAERPLKNYVVYSIAKAGLVGLTRTLARELAPDVRVNAVAPGPVLWPDDESFDELSRQRIISHTPLKREGTPDDIAVAVYFLLADAHYVTGGSRSTSTAAATSRFSALEASARRVHFGHASQQSRDLRGEPLEVRIDDAVRDERDARALEVVERRAEGTRGVGDDAGLGHRRSSFPAYCGWSCLIVNASATMRRSAACTATHFGWYDPVTISRRHRRCSSSIATGDGSR